MSKRAPLFYNLETMIEVVTANTRLSLTSRNLLEYGRMFHMGVKLKEINVTCERMWKEGTLMKIKDGRYTYWKYKR